MEEGCFSSRGSRKKDKSSQLSSKVAAGLAYPIYIITNSYNSPHLDQLHKKLEAEKITLSFQNSLEKL
jgi:hypothetical protein